MGRPYCYKLSSLSRRLLEISAHTPERTVSMRATASLDMMSSFIIFGVFGAIAARLRISEKVSRIHYHTRAQRTPSQMYRPSFTYFRQNTY